MTKRKTKKRTTDLGQELIQAAKDMVAHARGEKYFPTTYYYLPDKADIKEIRTNLHFTQEQFANFIGASVHAVRHWENGRRKPDGTARTLLYILKVKPEAILDILKYKKR